MPQNPVASPVVSSTVGIRNVVIAPLTEDTETTLTYGDLQLLAGAIDVQITPENSEPDIQYSDDIEFDIVIPDPEIKVVMEQADIPLAIQEMILGNQIDQNGVLIRRADDKPSYMALGFKSEKADGTFRYIWLFKGRATPITETYHSREGKVSPGKLVRLNGCSSSARRITSIRRLRMKTKTASMLQRPPRSCRAYMCLYSHHDHSDIIAATINTAAMMLKPFAYRFATGTCNSVMKLCGSFSSLGDEIA